MGLSNKSFHLFFDKYYMWYYYSQDSVESKNMWKIQISGMLQIFHVQNLVKTPQLINKYSTNIFDIFKLYL